MKNSKRHDIRLASTKPYFVIVADHCASSAGKVELPVNKYHIPMIIYSPGNINPGKFEKLTAQIDIGPTILGHLNFNYKSKFFCQDVFKMEDKDQRAFISTYQSLGYIKNNKYCCSACTNHSFTLVHFQLLNLKTANFVLKFAARLVSN